MQTPFIDYLFAGAERVVPPSELELLARSAEVDYEWMREHLRAEVERRRGDSDRSTG